MTLELSPEQVRWLGGLLRGFCEDPIYEMEDEQELKERFLLLLDVEMKRGRNEDDFSPRIERELFMQAFGPAFDPSNDEQEEDQDGKAI